MISVKSLSLLFTDQTNIYQQKQCTALESVTPQTTGIESHTTDNIWAESGLKLGFRQMQTLIKRGLHWDKQKRKTISKPRQNHVLRQD